MKLMAILNKKTLTSAYVALCLAGTGLAAHADPIITNGSFEDGYHQPETSPSSTDRASDNPGTITDWVVGGNRLVASTAIEGSSDGTYAAAFDGYSSNSGNTLSQTFSTTVGTVYTLSFDAGVFGTAVTTQSILAQVTNSSNIVLNSNTFGLVAGFDPTPFSSYGFSFTATSTESTLLFEDINARASSVSCDTMLDNVIVTVATPEPSTWAMAFAGLGALLLVRLRQKSNFQV